MIPKNPKGFTIVELVIVIAVVAVLAAVLIPTFSEVIVEAQKSKDLALCRNIQAIIEAEKLLGSNISDYNDAMEILARYGIDNIDTLSSAYSISWDDNVCNFILTTSSDSIVIYDDQQAEAVDVQPSDPLNVDDEEKTVNIEVISNYPDIFDSSAFPSTALLNGSFTANIRPISPYYITDFSIKMGEVDITPQNFDANANDAVIEIPQVTADITITVRAVVNQVRISKDLKGETNYGITVSSYSEQQLYPGPGYVNNASLSENISAQGLWVTNATGYTSTGWMMLPWNTYDEIIVHIYIKDGIIEETNTSGSTKYYFYYDLNNDQNRNVIDISHQPQYLNDKKNQLKIILKSSDYFHYLYFRLSVKGDGENLVVTFNEPIFPES